MLPFLLRNKIYGEKRLSNIDEMFPSNITEHFMDYVKNCHQKSFFILEIYMERIIWDWEWSLVTVSQ